MGWNGSDSSKGATTKGAAASKGSAPSKGEAASSPLEKKHLPTTTSPALLKGALAGLAVVAVLAAIGYFIFGRARTPSAPSAPQKSSAIKDVAPATNRVEKSEKELHPGMVKIRGKWYPEYDEKGGKIWYSKYWVRYHTPVVHTNSVNRKKTFIDTVFDQPADREIAVLLNATPGAFRIGSHDFDKRFTNRFLESLKHPIIVSADDDERTAALKRAVNETKIELKARYDDGEDIVQVMNDAQKQLRELGLYREELRRMAQKSAREIKGDPAARKDVYDAANKMLAERGLQPLEMPSMLKRQLEMDEINSKVKSQKTK